MKEKQYLDHIDVVVTHICNKKCEHCIDKFRNISPRRISLKTYKKFLKMIRKQTKEPLEVLLLGGEPTVMPTEELIKMAKIAHKLKFRIIMSTNGKLTEKIEAILPYFDSVQVTVDSIAEIERWRAWEKKINVKLAGDATLTMKKLNWFIKQTQGYDRRSVSMYFTPDFKELCTDPEVWELLNGLEWKRNGSYLYAFYRGVRFKRCIPGETNIIDEPSVPKVYPNGNYNKTWNNEKLDDYLSGKWDKERTVGDVAGDVLAFFWCAGFYIVLFIIGILALPYALVLKIVEGIKSLKEKRKKKKENAPI